MLCAYFDCFSGAAGDMIVAALLDAGCPFEHLQATTARLNLPGVTLQTERVKRHGIAATRFVVTVDASAQKKHRHLSHILDIINAANLPPRVVARSTQVFKRLAEAEATVHGMSPEKVHFHEVGAADAIIDIVGAAAALERLGVDRIACSALPTGHGTVTCEHGVMPVPAPATAQLLKGVPLAECDESGELLTPTGAAVLTSLADSFGPPPAMRLGSVGTGAGTREGKTRANILRVLIGEQDTAAGAESDRVVVVEAQVDDCTGQAVAFACERLLEAGALDAYVVPITMKKGRPGQLVAVLCRPGDVAAMETILFRETTTFGVRRHDAARTKLNRGSHEVETPFGRVHVKLGRVGDRVMQAWPEYEDCARLARASGAALSDVQQAALSAWNERNA